MAGWLRNELDFRLRNLIRLKRGPAPLRAEAKDGLFGPEGAREAGRLVRTYGLQQWEAESGRTDFAASLFYTAMIERALRECGVRLPARLRVLDAGAGDWFYVRPLLGLLRRFGMGALREVALDGVELDAWALYRGFRSRHDWAEGYVGAERGARYIAGDLRSYQQPVDLALMLFPFLFDTDLLRWGLPRRYLKPEEVLAHVWSLVRPGGALLVANLGEAEREQQRHLLREAGIPVAWHAPFESPLFSYQEPRFVTVAVKKFGENRLSDGE